MKYLYLLLASVILSSCGAGVMPTCWSGGIPLRPTEESWHQVHVSSFGNTANAKAYKGLAHPQAQTSKYEKQVEKGGWVEIEDFKFFEDPVDVPQEYINNVLDLYRDLDSHQAYGPKTKCAGFHPDYAIVWTSMGKRRVIQLCYGCHEWKFFGPTGEMLTDISEKAYFGPLTRKWLKKDKE